MRFVALLPKHSAEHLQQIIPQAQSVAAIDCAELNELLRNGGITAALVDPHFEGDKTDALLRVIHHNPRSHFIAYVQKTAQSLRSVFTLSKHGVEDVFVHPVLAGDRRFLNIVAKIQADCLAAEVLAAVESKMKALPPELLGAVVDLFHRPYRYQTAGDIAREAGTSLRSVYRSLEKSELGTAKRLVMMAKAIHGYSYLRDSAASVAQVSDKLGYATPDSFSRHIQKYFGARPSDISGLLSPEEVLITLIEALNKPIELQRRSEGR